MKTADIYFHHPGAKPALKYNHDVDIVKFKMRNWTRFEIELTPGGFSVSVNKSATQSLKKPLLRKICFGGLYVAPQWPMGTQWNSDVRLKLNSILVE